MSSFEKKYYESEKFWSGDILQDEMNRNRISFTASLLPDGIASIVDVGCGNGIFINYLKQNCSISRIVGTDRSETALRMVNSESRLANIEQLPFEDREFDCATCLEVIEHLPQETFIRALAEISRVALKFIVITVPYNENLDESQTQCPECKTRFNADLHLRSFSTKTMTELFDSCGFECTRTQVFSPFKRNLGAMFLSKIESKGKFQSPICPICGFENPGYRAWSPKVMEEHISNPSPYNRIKQTFKKLWPKTTVPGFWIAGVYKRTA